MNPNQQEVKREIEYYAQQFGVDPAWACAVAMVESSLGENRISPTNCRGVFQMSSIAMEDLRWQMGSEDDDTVEIVCGLLFLRLLYRRWGTIEEATTHFCDPNDRSFYLDRVLGYMRSFAQLPEPEPPDPAAPSVGLGPVPEKKRSWWKSLWG